MKVLLTDKVRALQKDRNGAKELRSFVTTAKLNEPVEIKVHTRDGNPVKYRAKLVPQG